MALSEEVVHPRPQLTRAQWVDLSGPWQFTYDDDDEGLKEQWSARAEPFTRTINVPFPPESPASGVGESGFHPLVWYRRTFQRPSQEQGERLLLHCGAIDYRAHVWVNGQLVATHEGGHTPFSADITAALHPTGDQVLVVRADDAPHDLAQPRGKQDWEETPHVIWYHRTTGIWQPVWLEPVPATRITALRWTPMPDRYAMGLSVTLQRAQSTPLALRVTLALHDATLIDDTYAIPSGTQTLQRDLVFSPELRARFGDKLLWAPHQPTLIDATLTLSTMPLNEAPAVVDTVESYCGLRSVETGNRRFLLNGRPYYLRLALEQGYWPQSHLAAPSVAALRREVELAKELGFNGLRIHQKVEDPRFLYFCDRLGLLVWGEMANAFVFSTEAVQRLTREWLEVVERDYNHPCIVAWVPLNESWGVPHLPRDRAQRHFIQSLYHLTKALDPTRPAIDNEGWEHIVTDINGLHDYSFDAEQLRTRYSTTAAVEETLRAVQPGNHAFLLPEARCDEAPVMLTEFGGISYRPETGTRWFGYGTVTTTEAYLERFRALVGAILDSSVIAGFCYTQLTDTLQETNGLLTAERAHKLDPTEVRRILTRSSAAVPGDHTAALWHEQGIAANVDAPRSDTADS